MISKWPALAVLLTLAKSHGYGINFTRVMNCPWARLCELAYLPDRTILMRIYFRTLTLPKKAAKRVQNHFSDPLSDAIPHLSMKLAQAQELTARMLGYDSWHELLQVTKKGIHTPSLLDEYSDSKEQALRIDYQTEVLGTISPLIEPVRRQLALQLRVSSGMPTSDELSENIYQYNHIKYWVDPISNKGEWRFLPSLRTTQIQEDIFELQETLEEGLIESERYVEILKDYLQLQPENIDVITALLGVAVEFNNPHVIESDLLVFESTIDLCIPIDFSRRKKNILIWWEIDNRNFHRAVCMLAECFYRVGKFEKAKKWFNFSKKTCDHFTNYIEPYLKDLRLDRPIGKVHILVRANLKSKIARDT